MVTDAEFRALQRRVATLERAPGRGLDEVHEVRTIALPGASTDVVSTHTAGTVFGVWLLPVRIAGQLALRRAHAFVKHGGTPGQVNFGLAIYKALPPSNFDPNDPAGSPLSVALVTAVGIGKSTSTSLTRFNATLTREVTLDGSRADYYVGLQADSADAAWYCPGTGVSAPAKPIAFRTTPLGTKMGDFPESLTVQMEGNRPAPLVVLRSTTGIHLYGDPTND